MKYEKTEAWKTSDGKLHPTEEIAIKHENILKRKSIRKELSKLIKSPNHLQIIIDNICKEDSTELIKLLFEYRNMNTKIKHKIKLHFYE